MSVAASSGNFSQRWLRRQEQPRELDPLLLWPAVALLLFGLVMVYSSSIATAEGSKFTGHSPTFFLVRHTVFMCIGAVAAVVAFQMPMRA